MANIADESQVQASKDKQKDARKLQLADIKAVLATPEGRRVMLRFLNKTGMFAPRLWEPTAALHSNVARRDFGMFMWGEIEAADLEAAFQMIRENKEGEPKS